VSRAAPALLTPPEVSPGTVRAAGALLWRGAGDDLEVLLVHRPKYDDWSWPKGKLDDGETWPGAAVREVLEETGLHVDLGVPLPQAVYEIGADGRYRPKLVQYWAAREVAGDGELANEIDEVAWLPVRRARDRLHYKRDRVQLKALVALSERGRLDTWPLLLVRHARSVPRRRWNGDDARRTLDESGQEQAQRLVPILQAYGVRRVITSDAERCAATVAPYARLAGQRLLGRHSLSEEGFDDDADRSLRQLDKVIAKGEAAAVCTHRPLLPALLRQLAKHTDDAPVRGALHESASAGLLKGEALVAHLVGRGEHARVVAVERHTPC
jgi:8-oxo-dGTP diphosphatase